MAVLEAWSYRLPVLMTSACNLGTGFSRGAARKVGTSISEIVEGLSEFLQLPESDRWQMGTRGLELVAEQYTWQTIAQDFGRVYKWISSADPRPDDLLYKG